MTPADGVRARELFQQLAAARGAAGYPGAYAEDLAFVLQYAREAPLLYGHWRHLKSLYKAAEVAGPPEVLGTLVGRLDRAVPERKSATYQEGLPALQGARELVVAYPLAYALTNAGLVVLDLSDAVSPKVLSQINPGNCRHLVLDGGRAYVEVQGGYGTADRVHVYDMSQPERPQELGSLEVRRLRMMGVKGHHLLVVEAAGKQNGRFRIFDLSDLNRPVQTASHELSNVNGVAVVGSRAYVTRTGGSTPPGIYVFELEEPGQPRLLGFWKVAPGPALIGGVFVPAARRDRSLTVVNTEAPLPPLAEQQAAPPPPPPNPQEAGLLQRVAGLFRKAATNVVAEVAKLKEPEIPHFRLAFPEGDIQKAVVHGGHAYVASGYAVNAVSLTPNAKPTAVVQGCYGVALGVVSGPDGTQLMVLPPWNAPRHYLLSDPLKLAQLGVPPRADTLDYMKRRARRCLRHMAVQEPHRFVEVAFHALKQSGQGVAEMDLAHQWVMVDLLYGGSGRYLHLRHGRGGHRARWTGFWRRRREERAPGAWDRRPELMRDLLADPGLPWQVHEAALKGLRAQGAELPPLTAPQAAAFLASPSPLLRHEGTRALVPELLLGKPVPAEAAARAFFFARGADRTALMAKLQTRSGSPGWARPFSVMLLQQVIQSLEGTLEGSVPPRRVVSAAGLLNRGFTPFLPADRLLPVAQRLLRSGDVELQRLVLAGFRTVKPVDLAPWLRLWAGLPSEMQSVGWGYLTTGLKRLKFPVEVALELVRSEEDALQWLAWNLLRDLAPAREWVVALWTALLEAGQDTPALRAALASPAALELVRNSGAEIPLLGQRLTEVPALGALLSGSALETLAASLPPATLLGMAATVSDERWLEFREALFRGLRSAGRMASFWIALPDLLPHPGLELRLLEDPHVAASFRTLADPALLEIKHPAFEALLLDWVTEQRELLAVGSSTLLAAATHPLPTVRAAGLARVRELGTDLPFSLRLLESGVPSAMEVGRAYFDAAPAGTSAELNGVLALSDSPERAVRSLAREMIQERKERLPLEELAPALAEHGDPAMNHFLAELLTDAPPEISTTEPVREFDRGVLRAPNRGRRAKERVKSRLGSGLAEGAVLESAVLLELARGGTPRDAEWALEQLARRALAGQSVEGVRLEGTAGV